MTQSALDGRRRRLHFRAWRRGMREVDLLLGPFADAHLADLDPVALAGFEALLDVPDQDLYRWIVEGEAPPDRHSAMLDRVIAFHRGRAAISGPDA